METRPRADAQPVRNPKAEGRNPNKGGNPKAGMPSALTGHFSEFGLRVSFGLRNSVFGPKNWCGRRVVPGRPDIRPGEGGILLLNHSSKESKRAGSVIALPALPFNKEHTPLVIWLDTNPRFHGGSFGVLGHTSCEALRL